jgi:excisionase family DNA binding protein
MNDVTWLTIPQAAESLGVSTDTVRRRIADGTIPATRLGPRLIRIRLSDLSSAGTAMGVA